MVVVVLKNLAVVGVDDHGVQAEGSGFRDLEAEWVVPTAVGGGDDRAVAILYVEDPCQGSLQEQPETFSGG